MSVDGPSGPAGNQPSYSSPDSTTDPVRGKTRHRTVKEIEAAEGYLSNDLHGLIEQVSRTFSPKTAEIIRTANVFDDKRGSHLSAQDRQLVISLANQVQTLSDQGSSSSELNLWAHKELQRYDSISSLDSGLGRSITSGSDTEDDASTAPSSGATSTLSTRGSLASQMGGWMQKSSSLTDSFDPDRAEVDLGLPEIASEVLMTLGSHAMDSVADRQNRYKLLLEDGEKAAVYVNEHKHQQSSAFKDPDPTHHRQETNTQRTGQLEHISFRARALATPKIAEQFEFTDFSSPEQMQRMLAFITEQLSASASEQEYVASALKKMRTLQAAWEQSGDKKELAALCQQIRELAKATSDTRLSETFILLADHLAERVMSQVRAEFEASVREQLKELEKPGSARVLTVSAGLGVGFAAYGIEGASLDFGIKYSFAVGAGNDTKIREVHIVDCSTTAGIGDEKIATGSITLDMKNAKGKVFRNLDDFVSYHANDLVPMLLGKFRHTARNVQGAIRSKKQQNQKLKTVANAELLTSRLQEYGILLPSQKVQTTLPHKPGYSEFRQMAGAVSGGISALAGMFDASLTMTNTVTRFKKHIDLLPTLKDHPDQFMTPKESFITFWVPVTEPEMEQAICALWDDRQSNGMIRTTSIADIPEDQHDELREQVFADRDYKKDRAGRPQKRISAKKAINWIKSCQEECRCDTTPKERKLQIREECKQAILDQYSERDLYFFTLNARDGYIGVEPGRKQHLRQAEKSFRATCDAKKPAEFLEAHTCTYYGLWKTYMMTFGNNESPATDDASFFKPLEQFIEPTLTRPQVHIGSEKEIQKHLQIPAKAKSTEKSVEFEVSVNVPKSPISGSINASYANAKDSTNPDNDGESLSLSFTVGAGGHLGKAIVTAGNMISQKKADQITLAKLPLELALSSVELADFEMNAESDVTLELSFSRRDPDLERPEDDEEQDWHLEYARVTGTNSMGAKIPNAGIPTGPVGELKVNFGAKVSGTNHWYERPGNNTTGYIQTRYNGWKSGGKIGGDHCYWQTWAKQNKKCLKELLVNMGRQTRNASEEIRETFKDIETYLPGFTEKMTFRDWLEFKKDFTVRLQLFAACEQLGQLASKAPVSEAEMRRHFEKLQKDFPNLPTMPTEAEFVSLRDSLKKSGSTLLEKAFGIDKKAATLDFESDMLPVFQRFLDLQHQAHTQIARMRYKPSLRRMKEIH